MRSGRLRDETLFIVFSCDRKVNRQTAAANPSKGSSSKLNRRTAAREETPSGNCLSGQKFSSTSRKGTVTSIGLHSSPAAKKTATSAYRHAEKGLRAYERY